MTAEMSPTRRVPTAELERCRRRSARYHDRAEAYARAATQLVDRLTEETAPPYFMLIAHAAELALKAVISGGRCDDEDLMRLGHDLPLCLRVADFEGADLAVRGEVRALVEALAMPHLAQTLRYPAYMSWPLPEPRAALDALEALLACVRVRIDAGQTSASSATQLG